MFLVWIYKSNYRKCPSIQDMAIKTPTFYLAFEVVLMKLGSWHWCLYVAHVSPFFSIAGMVITFRMFLQMLFTLQVTFSSAFDNKQKFCYWVVNNPKQLHELQCGILLQMLVDGVLPFLIMREVKPFQQILIPLYSINNK